MKIQIALRILILFSLAGILVVSSRRNPMVDSADVIDQLVDAGLEFYEDRASEGLIEYRTIVLTKDINSITAQRVIQKLLLLNASDASEPIDLYIRTGGGWLDDAFAIIDVIHAIDAPVNTHAMGGTHSSGSMILAAGTGLRYGYPNSSIMFHAGLYSEDGPYSEGLLDNKRITSYWMGHACIPNEWLTAEDEDMLYLSSKQALAWGIIDQIMPNNND